jgi:hypothetical protein
VHATELELHNRQLDGLDDPAFLHHLAAWLVIADHDDRSRRVLAALRDQYGRTLADHRHADEETVLRLREVRELLRVPAPHDDQRDAGERPRELIALLRRELRRLCETDPIPEGYASLVPRFDQIVRTHDRRQRKLMDLLHDSACGSLRRLDWLADEMASRPRALLEPMPSPQGGALQAALASVRPLLRAALTPNGELTASEQRQLGHIVAAARVDAARVQARVLWRARASVPRQRGYCA